MVLSKNWKKDIYRYYGKYNISFLNKLKMEDGLKIIINYRKARSNCILKYLYRLRSRYINRKCLCQIPYTTKIGEGLYIGHACGIIINPNAVIGKNVNIAQGVTIGQENRGKRKGTPTIGDKVWIGANAVVVGNIKIGDDVLIAPNSFVNFDVPAHSIVVGNPGKIIPRENATEGYVNKIVE